MAEVRERFGMRIVTEALDHEPGAGRPLRRRDQIGAQHAELLPAEGGRAERKPVLLKRGMSATLDEFLMAAEYMSEGNYRSSSASAGCAPSPLIRATLLT
jgi:3-deoxy-7-phosphoheptulonate synthase